MSASILLNLVRPDFNMAEKFGYVSDFIKKIAGGEYLGFNNTVCLSERDTADGIFALAYLLRENSCFPQSTVNFDISDVLDFYLQVSLLQY